jgi:glycine/D-amino acid oxidase-like deaminating enzyme/nitrite reductase/ring-hydroxylating ferredoxin subunit
MDRPDISSGASATPWLTSASRPIFPLLEEDLEVDVVIVGGGISGLTTAYLLTKEKGLRVAVLEDGAIGSGETGRTTAHLASALDDRFERLIELHGEDGARRAYQSHAAAIDEIEAIAERHRIDCDFERLPGFLFTPPGESTDLLDREFEACPPDRVSGSSLDAPGPAGALRERSLPDVPRPGAVPSAPLSRRVVGGDRAPGGRIFERTRVEDFELGERIKIAARAKGAVTARALVVATNAPFLSRFKFPLRQFPYRSYVVALRVPAGTVTKALYWDTADPYHYLRLQPAEGPGTELLIVGGEDHKTGQPGEDDGNARYDRAGGLGARAGAAGRRAELPLVGAGDGAGRRARVPRSLPDDGRQRLRGDGRFGARDDPRDAGGDDPERPDRGARESLGVALRPGPEHARGDRRAGGRERERRPAVREVADGGDVASTQEIPKGEGRVLRHGLQKRAVYRDEAGGLHTFSAVCPHLGCIVGWNGAEKTWDCPCHGSRFSAKGEVLNGPANSPLQAIRKTPARIKREKKPVARGSSRRGPKSRRRSGG